MTPDCFLRQIYISSYLPEHWEQFNMSICCMTQYIYVYFLPNTLILGAGRCNWCSNVPFGSTFHVLHLLQYMIECIYFLSLLPLTQYPFTGSSIPSSYTVYCFWVSDLDHHNRGPHEPVSAFLHRPWHC